MRRAFVLLPLVAFTLYLGFAITTNRDARAYHPWFWSWEECMEVFQDEGLCSQHDDASSTGSDSGSPPPPPAPPPPPPPPSGGDDDGSGDPEYGYLISPENNYFDSEAYTYSEDSCSYSNAADPINVIYYDWGTWRRAENQTKHHVPFMDNPWFGTTQWFWDHGHCWPMKTQLATANGNSTRYHIRLHPVPYDAYGLGWTTVGDAHHEDWVWQSFWNPNCYITTYQFNLPGNHAIDEGVYPNGYSGFDLGRDFITAGMANSGHSYTYDWWGNTMQFEQCDGDHAGGDGWVTYIHTHQGTSG